MTVTEIIPQKRHLSAVVFSEDYLPENARVNKQGQLLLDRDYCDESGIRVGTALTYSQADEHFYFSELRRAKSKAMWLLEQQDYPSGKLMEKLCKDFSFAVSSAAVARLAEIGLVNDEAYAFRLAESLLKKGTPSKRLPFAMAQKGLDISLAKRIANEINSDDKAAIEKLLNTKYVNKLSNETDLQKTVAALLRRGFSYSDIKSVMGDMSENFYYGDE